MREHGYLGQPRSELVTLAWHRSDPVVRKRATLQFMFLSLSSIGLQMYCTFLTQMLFFNPGDVYYQSFNVIACFVAHTLKVSMSLRVGICVK